MLSFIESSIIANINCCYTSINIDIKVRRANWIRKQICGGMIITVGVVPDVEEVTLVEVWLVVVLITIDGIKWIVAKTT